MDRAPLTVVIWDAPDDERPSILAILNEHHLDPEYGWGDGELTSFELGVQYGDDEVGIGVDDEIFGELCEAAAGSTFTVSQDPKYEFDGAVSIYAPGLGAFGSTANSEGVPYITADAVRKVTSLEEVRLLLGLPWLDRIDFLRPKVSA